MQRQYTGTTGKIDNCQLGVFLAVTSCRGRALIDHELYLPTSWTEDPTRCAAAGSPDGTGFATKPQQGVAMLARVHATGALMGWVSADATYSQTQPSGPGSPGPFSLTMRSVSFGALTLGSLTYGTDIKKD